MEVRREPVETESVAPMLNSAKTQASWRRAGQDRRTGHFGRPTLINNIDKKGLALALKGASDQIRDLFFANMSVRSGKLLKDDMEPMGPVRLKDVDEAQSKMVNTAKDMAARGEIVLNKGKSDEEMIG